MGIPVPKPVQDLVDSLRIVGLPSSGRYNLNEPLQLSLNYGANAFDALASPREFVVNLTKVDLPGLDVSRVLNLDLGALGFDSVGTPGALTLNVGTIDLQDDQGNPGGLKVDRGTSTFDTDVVLKDSEFDTAELLASDVDLQTPAANALPYLVPNTSGILGLNTKAAKGVLGRMKGKLEQKAGSLGAVAGRLGQAVDNLGSIAGALKQTPNNPGTITLPSLRQKKDGNGELVPLGTIVGKLGEGLEESPVVQVEWRIRDNQGQPIPHKTVVKGDLAGELGKAIPLVALIPDFVEFKGADLDLVSVRQISCQITVTVPGFDSPPPTLLGPFEIRVPQIQVPTVMVMGRHAIGDGKPKDFPDDALIAVPKASVLAAKAELAGPLNKAKLALELVRNTLTTAQLGIPDQLEGLLKAVNHVVSFTNLDRFAFEKADKVTDLFWVGWTEWGFLSLTYYPFEDTRSSLVMIGPPGRAARCHTMKNLWERHGVFQVTLGPEAFVVVDDFSKTVNTEPNSMPGPSAVPAGSLEVVTGDPRLSPKGSFENELSSYQFL